MTIKDKLQENKDKIIKLYNDGMGIDPIGNILGCSGAYISAMLKEWGIEVRSYKISEEVKKRIMDLYQKGKSAYAIDIELQLTRSTAARVIKSNGFDISNKQRRRDDMLKNHTQEIIEKYQSGLGYDAIAKIYFASPNNISKILKKNGIKIRSIRDYANKVDENFFEKIDSEEKAYILGWMYSDGSNDNKSGRIRLSITDLEILEKIKEKIKFQGNFYIVKPRKESQLTQYCLQIGSRKMSDDLHKLGCSGDKTYSLKFPTLDKVPLKFLNSLLRGWMDGDGTITKNEKRGKYNVKILSTKNVCEGIKSLCETFLNLNVSIYVCSTNPKTGYQTYAISIDSQQAIKTFLDFIYKDSTIYLKRKHDKYLEFLSEHTCSPANS